MARGSGEPNQLDCLIGGDPAAYSDEDPGQVRLLAVAVLDLPGGDLLEGDLQVVLGAGLHHRRRILVERPLAEVVVVRVDLPGALGGHQHHGVVGINALEQLVQTWLDHGGHMVAARPASSSTARSRSSLTRWWSNSSRAASSSRAAARRRSICSGESEPRCISRSARASNEGGSMKMRFALGSRSWTWRAPWTSISRTIPRAGRSSSLHSVP